MVKIERIFHEAEGEGAGLALPLTVNSYDHLSCYVPHGPPLMMLPDDKHTQYYKGA